MDPSRHWLAATRGNVFLWYVSAMLARGTDGYRATVPTQEKAIRDHIRRRRLTMKLTQEQVAEQLSDTTASVYNWESDDSKSCVEYIPAIIQFLGYNPSRRRRPSASA